MNILFVGSSSSLSLIPITALITSEYTVCAVATNEINNSIFSAINTGTIQSLAFYNSIPIINLNENIVTVVNKIVQYQPDVIITSCYPHKVPEAILSVARMGAYNLHPSLLPAFRGPSPLFWQFHAGVDDFGVSLHRMTAEFDQGSIVAQKKIKMKDEININDATKLIASTGAQLLLGFLDDLNKNNVIEVEQDESVSSYQTFSTIVDYTVSALWDAKRLYNFINAYKERDVFFLCKIEDKEYKLVDALSYKANAYKEMTGDQYKVMGDMIFFACRTGFVQCRIKLS